MGLCIECGVETNGRHHVVPRSLGGIATVALCVTCHEKAHGDREGTVFRADLIKLGIERRRLSGKHVGAPNKVDASMIAIVKDLRADGLSMRRIATVVKLSLGTIHKMLQVPTVRDH